MATFNQVSNILHRKFTKRRIYQREQFYDLEVEMINDSITIDISSSQLLKAKLNLDKDTLELLIDDLKEIAKL